MRGLRPPPCLYPTNNHPFFLRVSGYTAVRRAGCFSCSISTPSIDQHFAQCRPGDRLHVDNYLLLTFISGDRTHTNRKERGSEKLSLATTVGPMRELLYSRTGSTFIGKIMISFFSLALFWWTSRNLSARKSVSKLQMSTRVRLTADHGGSEDYQNQRCCLLRSSVLSPCLAVSPAA